MRHAFRRFAVLLALIALAAGTGGDVPSLFQRTHRTTDTAYAAAKAQPALATVTDPTAAAVAPGSASATPKRASTTTVAEVPTTTAPAPRNWTLFAAGDVLMDRSEPAGRDPFAQLVPPLDEADVALVNLETPVAAEGTPQAEKEFVFLSPPSSAKTMAAAGIDVANLGNNHTLDHGPGALLETVSNLRDAGIAPVGAGADAGAAYAPARFEVGPSGAQRVSLAVIGATQVLPPGWAAGAEPGVATDRSPRLLQAVRDAAATHDVVVVTVHWGVEREPCPSDRQLALGDALISAGADAVIGHHPHVLQPVVERGGGVIAYSLGNFAWHSRTGPPADTGVLELRFAGAAFDGFTFHPHRIDHNGDPAPTDSETRSRIEAAVDPAACPGL